MWDIHRLLIRTEGLESVTQFVEILSFYGYQMVGVRANISEFKGRLLRKKMDCHIELRVEN